MYNKSSGAIVYKLLVSSAIMFVQCTGTSKQVPVAGTNQLVPATGTRNRSVWHGLKEAKACARAIALRLRHDVIIR